MKLWLRRYNSTIYVIERNITNNKTTSGNLNWTDDDFIAFIASIKFQIISAAVSTNLRDIFKEIQLQSLSVYLV